MGRDLRETLRGRVDRSWNPDPLEAVVSGIVRVGAMGLVQSAPVKKLVYEAVAANLRRSG